MSKSFAKDKGARAERAVIELLQPVVKDVYESFGMEQPKLQRNTLQSDGGGYDIVGLDWLALEVKHQEAQNVAAWWEQANRQAKSHQTPVLFYKKNNVKFRVMMYGLLVPGGASNIRCAVDIDVESFLLYFKHRLTKELQK